jgi:NitT/TauT family transport system ATP-binding protein
LHGGSAELEKIAASRMLKVDELFPIAGAMHILEFAELHEGMIRLTAAGRVFAQADDDERKRLFREHLVQFVPLASHIREVLVEREGHRAPRERFELELQDHLNQSDADSTPRTVIDWGRYAGLFSYDDHTRTFGG